LQAERDENTCRLDLAPSEALALAQELEPYEHREAQERMRTGKPSEKFSRGRALDRIAGAVGTSRATLTKIQAVTQAAEQDPARFGPIAEEMDRTGKVDRAYRQVRALERGPQPRVEHRVIGADRQDDLPALPGETGAPTAPDAAVTAAGEDANRTDGGQQAP